MSKKRLWIILLAVAVVVASIILTNGYVNHLRETTESPIVRIGYRSHQLYAPLFVGIENGYFSELGLQVEPVIFASTNQTTDALLAGRIDAALGGINSFILFNIEEKAPNTLKIFTLVNEDNAHPSSYLLVKHNSTIKSLADLSGKKIASHPGSSVRILFRKLAKVYNWQNTELLQMSQELELPALAAGQVDAAIVLEPLGTIGTRSGVSDVLESALFDKYFITDLPLAASVIASDYLNKHPQTTGKLITATNKAIDFINNNPAETNKIIAKYTALSEDIAADSIIPTFRKASAVDIEPLSKLRDLFLAENEIKNKVSIENMILK